MTSKPSGNTETKKTKLAKLVTFAVGICSNQWTVEEIETTILQTWGDVAPLNTKNKRL